MPAFSEKKERQKRLLYITISAILIGGVVLYFGFFRPPGTKIPEEPTRRSRVLESTGLDTSILKDTRLTGLRPYAHLTHEIQTGRSNPFSPYETETAPVFEGVNSETIFEEEL